jgi:hypothetical protein
MSVSGVTSMIGSIGAASTNSGNSRPPRTGSSAAANRKQLMKRTTTRSRHERPLPESEDMTSFVVSSQQIMQENNRPPPPAVTSAFLRSDSAPTSLTNRCQGIARGGSSLGATASSMEVGTSRGRVVQGGAVRNSSVRYRSPITLTRASLKHKKEFQHFEQERGGFGRDEANSSMSPLTTNNLTIGDFGLSSRSYSRSGS